MKNIGKTSAILRAYRRLEKWGKKYEISIQAWPNGQNNLYIAKDGVDLWSSGGFDTPLKAIQEAVNWIESKQPPKKYKYEPRKKALKREPEIGNTEGTPAN